MKLNRSRMYYFKRYWLLLPYAAIILFPSCWLIFFEPATWFDWRYTTAQLFGFTGASLLLMELVLATRWTWLDRMIGFDRLTRVHKWAGIIGLTCIALHALGISLYYFDFGFATLWAFIQPGWRWETLGMLSFDTMVLIVLLTLIYRRLHLPYHWWKRVHFFMYVAILGGFLHSLYLGSHLVSGTLRWYWTILGAIAGLSLLHRRMLVPLMARSYRVQAHQVIAQNVHHVELVPVHGKVLDYQPGQFVFVQFKSTGISREWHPFTISSRPNSSVLTLTMKESGDWTKQLNSVQVDTIAKVEGPYGQFSYQRLPHDDMGYVFVAGGIGITPLHAMITALLATDTKRPLTLLYSARSEQDFAFKETFDQLARTHANFKVVYTTERLTRQNYEAAIPEPLQQHYFICGPKPMMRGMRQLLATMGVTADHIHFEEFALN